MNWQKFIDKLLRDFRTSSYRLDQDFGISMVAIHQIKSGKTAKPQQKTIKKLEGALGIEINDGDPENLSYKKLPPNEEGKKDREREKFHALKLDGQFDDVNIRERAYE